MKAYHKFLAHRYARRNVFWVLGGDATGSLQGIIPYTDMMAQCLLEGAEAAWQSRRVDEARRWAERGVAAAPGPKNDVTEVSAR